MKKLLLLLLTCFACSAPAVDGSPGIEPGSAETISEAQQPVTATCWIVSHTDYVNPLQPAISYPNGTVDMIARVLNQGPQACSYKISVSFYDVPYDGVEDYSTAIVQGPTLAAGSTKGHAWGGIPMQRNCYYQVWLKFSETVGAPQTWHGQGVYTC